MILILFNLIKVVFVAYHVSNGTVSSIIPTNFQQMKNGRELFLSTMMGVSNKTTTKIDNRTTSAGTSTGATSTTMSSIFEASSTSVSKNPIDEYYYNKSNSENNHEKVQQEQPKQQQASMSMKSLGIPVATGMTRNLSLLRDD